MVVPPQAELRVLVASPDFNAFVEQIKRELQVVIFPNLKTSNGGETPTETSFKFRCQRSNSDFLVTAREMLVSRSRLLWFFAAACLTNLL